MNKVYRHVTVRADEIRSGDERPGEWVAAYDVEVMGDKAIVLAYDGKSRNLKSFVYFPDTSLEVLRPLSAPTVEVRVQHCAEPGLEHLYRASITDHRGHYTADLFPQRSAAVTWAASYASAYFDVSFHNLVRKLTDSNIAREEAE